MAGTGVLPIAEVQLSGREDTSITLWFDDGGSVFGYDALPHKVRLIVERFLMGAVVR